MPDPVSGFSLNLISNHVSGLLDGIAPRLVTIHGRRRGTSSGFLWRPGLVITAEEALEADDDITVMRPDGSKVTASLVGRDPSTDIALLRTEEEPSDEIAFSPTDGLRAGHLVLAAGRQLEGPSAALGIVSLTGAAWKSLRGGHIDRRIHLDLRLDFQSEGGVALDTSGKVLGMAVFGPRRRALVIPSETIERVAPQLLEKGRVARGYLGLGLQPIRIDQAAADTAGLSEPRGLIVVSLDQDGPGQSAGIRQGDILVRWNNDTLPSVRRVFRLLGPESVGQAVDLGILRAGEHITLAVEIRERPAPQ
ncbi:S1C family serine protease [Microvirga lotononidis]|uniref:Trypsin-like serine protease with C-terminal PDZ domain n=1 Tax=Microvirga lotononidis TaxID=864069 RepID=I4YVA8_9HYPH|nr:S1C family serine protease [Microvirga lotononidis]EIM27900.1 trypsin-like serine protease with C-terminal PDZ domain [Microvirga lotononidis]WQO27974.1 S1C family serine protease [Microvirga lotononidis]